jgi:DNA (cytosine-5)-methyltransferase 1
MKHGSLFSGIGGFDLAARWMGWDNVFHVEFNPWCRQVLEYHFPNSQSFTDVKQFDGTAWRGHVDIISGGFPCQPYSAAGKRMGKEDERHLWPEMLRIIREAAPTYVVGENVRGLTNWNGGVVFEEVCADLEAAGYEVWTGILPAAGVGAPHRRDRVWFVAHADDNRTERTSRRDESAGKGKGIRQRHEVQFAVEPGEVQRDATNASSKRPQCWQGGIKPKKKPQPNDQFTKRRNELRIPNWEMFPTQPPICGGDDGIPRELDGISFSKWRNESIKAYGNAIVPQVAFEIFNAIQKTNENRSVWNH